MSSSGNKVVYLSIVKDNVAKKWYQSNNRFLNGEEIAEKLQHLLEEEAHRGYRMLQIIDAFGNFPNKEAVSVTFETPRPSGLIVVFEQV
jgi:phosphopantetheine adenylyltransferase